MVTERVGLLCEQRRCLSARNRKGEPTGACLLKFGSRTLRARHVLLDALHGLQRVLDT